MAVKPERIYRDFINFEVRKAEGVGEERSYLVEGYATTFNQPYAIFETEDGTQFFESVNEKAFEGADLRDVIFQYNHDGMVFARKKNGTLSLEVDEHGLKVVADLSRTADARRMYEAIAEGLIDQMSFAFTVAKDSYDKQTRTRTLERIKKVYDVSAVSIPANPSTDISTKRFFDGVIEEERQELLEAEKVERQRQRIRLLTEVL